MKTDIPVVALKVDVDTYIGTRDGVPRILDILDRFGIRATFYFSMGPDNSGKAIRRIFTRKGFLKKMLRTGAPSAYGLKTMLYGTLLPAPMIASSLPEILRQTERRGHETGIHCWDHVKWHDYLPWLPKPMAALELGQASAMFQEIMGHRADSTAAPGWTVSPDSLEIQDALQLSYCSDSRGHSPFFPVMAGKQFQTLQIPTTWPTADEVLGENSITMENLHGFYLHQLKEGLNVHTIHAEMEGKALSDSFEGLLKGLQARGAVFMTLGEIAKEFRPAAGPATLEMGDLPGRAGKVAIQH